MTTNIHINNAQVIATALTQLYVREGAGATNNLTILQFAKDCGFTNYTNDSIAWCALFVNWVLWKCGCERSKSLLARDFLKVTGAVPTPEVGDVMVFWRDKPDSIFGHVAFFINEKVVNGVRVYRVLGGNQGDEIKIIDYPADRLLGIRRPTSLLNDTTFSKL